MKANKITKARNNIGSGDFATVSFQTAEETHKAKRMILQDRLQFLLEAYMLGDIRPEKFIVLSFLIIRVMLILSRTQRRKFAGTLCI